MNIQTSVDTAAALSLPQPYLLFLGDATESGFAKTAYGLRDWAPEKCVGEYALPTATVSTGLPVLTPAEAAAKGARSVLIGIANRGGVISPEWIPALVEALEAGLDIVSGMHARLAEIPELATAAERLGRQLIDVRHPPLGLPVGTDGRPSAVRDEVEPVSDGDTERRLVEQGIRPVEHLHPAHRAAEIAGEIE